MELRTLTAPHDAPSTKTRAPIDREALVRAVISVVPRARARAALRSVRAFLRVALGAAEAHALERSCVSPADRDELRRSARAALEGAASALASEPEGDLAYLVGAALLGVSPLDRALLLGVFTPDDERRDALRALGTVNRVSRELRRAPALRGAA